MKATPKSQSGKDGSSKYERRRADIIIAAAAVFAEKGFHGASTRDIANRLGLQQGSLYYYFDSKEAALEAVCLEGINESVARLKQLLNEDLSFAETIGRIIYNQLYGLETHCDVLVVFMDQRRFLPGDRRGRVRARGAEFMKLLVEFFRNGQHRGEVSSEIRPELAARALIGLCDSVTRWFQQEGDLDIEGIARQYTRLFCAGIQS